MTPDQKICDQHFREAWITQISSAHKGVYKETDGLLATYWTIQLPPFNRIFIQEETTAERSANQILKAIKNAKSPYDANKLCWELCLHDQQQERLASLLDSLDLGYCYSQPAMVLDPTAEIPESYGELELLPIQSMSQLKQFNQLTAQAYNLSPQVINLLLTPQFLQREESTLVSGWVNNTMVCIAATIETKSCTGIYWVATHPDHQRKGYGEYITRHVIHLAKKRGASTITLQASEAGRPLYEKMGFKTILNYKFYIPKAFLTNSQQS